MRTGLFILAFLSLHTIQAQPIIVNSLAELLPHLSNDNVEVKLAPGVYDITTSDVLLGKYSNPLLLFEGSNSIYDFTGVTINIDTNVFTLFGSVAVNEIQILGNNNVLKNLTMVDVGSTAPKKTAQAIIMDGKDNRIEGFHVTVRGSYPYGYGDAFGKGGGAVIKHRKHSGILIRGLRNHLKNTTVISRAYGHIVFMQAASYPIIEGCYMEGEMRTTDDMLAETSGPAFDVGFMTTWGYKLPAGYMMSLQEGGIRAYNGGTTYIDGVEIERGTDNPTVLNCTIKNARTGVTLAHATGTKYVEGCTVLGSENGYSIGSGTVVNCGADAIYGPVFKNTYGSDNGYVADITILPPSDAYYNGHGAIAYIGGKNHNLTFRSDITTIPSNLKIMVSGDLQGLRVLNGSNASQNNFSATDIVVKNLTNFPIVLHSDSSNISGQSCGTITDNGTQNTMFSNCNYENLAVLGTASQSSSRSSDGFAANAIDGNTDGVWVNNSVSHTLSEANPWWQVTLQSETALGEIKIFNRTDNCCKARLSDFTVYVLDSNEELVFSKVFTNYPDPAITLNAGGVQGQIVKIVLNGTGALSLAEVEVFEASLSVKNTKGSALRLYPNPVRDNLVISLTNIHWDYNEINIALYDINGRKVMEIAPKNLSETILDVSQLNRGVYFLKLDDTSKSITRKVVKL
ncbi:T9SS type A sorting domain-containing protein [Mariniflexile ostreae]|uniref:T9SS type A sorting domain-containing protein n=2 Tax=Mariniflexile ostreae TaxID=1520892 RepID=A0ABV5FD02_9FLAO